MDGTKSYAAPSFLNQHLHRINSISPPVWYSFLRTNYLLVGYALLTFFLGFIALDHTVTLYLEQGPFTLTFAFFAWLTSFIYTNVILSQFDAISRYQTYKKAKDMLYTKKSIDDSKMWPYVVSMCQRKAVLQASRELGMDAMVEKYFWDKGYRFYHVIPDFCLTHPLFWTSMKFWNFTFFCRYYEPVVDYEAVYQAELRGESNVDV